MLQLSKTASSQQSYIEIVKIQRNAAHLFDYGYKGKGEVLVTSPFFRVPTNLQRVTALHRTWRFSLVSLHTSNHNMKRRVLHRRYVHKIGSDDGCYTPLTGADRKINKNGVRNILFTRTAWVTVPKQAKKSSRSHATQPI